MVAIFTVIALSAVLGYVAWQYALVPDLGKKQTISKDKFYLLILLLAGFVIRAICAVAYKGHDSDMACFAGWANNIFENGPWNFYKDTGFTDYPPGYMYILYVVGALRKLFSLEGNAYHFLLKLPSIIADLGTGYLIYKIANKNLSNSLSATISAVYVFNPAVICDSALWGQVDSVYTIFIALMIYLISEKKLIPSYFVFAVCILIKPHAFIYTPLLFYSITENYIYPHFDKKGLLKTLGFGVLAIVFMVLLALPFDITEVFNQYVKTITEEYPYFTVNAFNLWGAFGLNWKDLSAGASIANYVILALIVAYSAYIFFKSKNESKYFYTAGLLAFFTFMLSTKMHERYGFPVMVFLLLALIGTKNVHSFILYVVTTLSQFFNIAWVLFIYQQDPGKYAFGSTVNIASIINLVVLAYMIYVSQKLYVNNNISYAVPTTVSKKSAEKQPTKKSSPAKKKERFQKTRTLSKLVKADIIAMAAITLVYSGVALYDLGDMKAPETNMILKSSTIDLGADREVKSLKFFLGAKELNSSDRAFDLICTDTSGKETYKKTVNSGSVFYWNSENIDKTVSKITLNTTSNNLYLYEIGIVDKNGDLIEPEAFDGNGTEILFDEQYLVPERASFRNGTYFDEIYHARTAYEFTEHMSVYEWTHPPLGKIFISLGIMLFGMNPFGWRIAGTIFGILMIPLIYIFAKKLFGKTWLSIVTCLLFTFDFMHFAQTRIATIDVYVTFFIILMYLFMFKYYTMSFYDTPLKKTLIPLAFCGIAMGLGIASKWTGVYAAIGLAIIFFITLFKRYSEYDYAMKNPKGETDGISHQYVIDNFGSYAAKTIGWCCIFFIAVPLIIYGLSYIPYLMAPDAEGLKTIINNQNAMLTYHGSTVLGSEHPFSSKWYEWIIIKRPIWYYSGTVADGIKEGISSFGNPLVWWFGIAAFIYMVINAITKKDKISIFFVIAYLAQLVPWMGIERLTFIYHYFPCVPFVALMIGYSIKVIYDEAKDKKSVIIGAFVYAGLAIILFAMFYPVLSGQPCSTEYAENFLKWFDSWVLL